MDEEDLLDAKQQRLEEDDFAERFARPQRLEPPLPRAQFSDSTIDARLAATALRMAGPITGKRASASGRGSRRTDAVIARSTGGVSARASSGSDARCSNA